MELLEGGDLMHFVKRNGKLDEKTAALCIQNILLGVKKLNDQEIIHRDLKLENILLQNERNPVKLVLADFGLSTFFGQTQLFGICGTPGYFAPEILEGKEYDKQIDVFSIGVILFAL